MTVRIQRLKDKVLESDDRTVFLERLSLMKRGYEKYRERTPSVRYALILDEILSGMSVVIDEDDLIVGRAKETIPTNEEEEALRQIAAYYSAVCPEAVAAPETDVEDWAYSGRPTSLPAVPNCLY